MKTKLTLVLSAVSISCVSLLLPSSVMAQGLKGEVMHPKPSTNQPPSSSQASAAVKGSGGATVAEAISPEEAAKKYPAKGGSYPMGERDPHKPSGVVSSPYPPHEAYDCSKVAHGGLVVDTRVKRVFVRP